MKNIISVYKKFKLDALSSLCNIIKECKDGNSKTILNRYLENYFNGKFYNIYETIEGNKEFDLLVLEEEYNGLEYELEDSYITYQEDIRDYKRISYFVVSIDRIYEDKVELENLLEEKIVTSSFVEELLGDKKQLFIKKYIEMSEKENKIFQTDTNEFFTLNIKEQNDLKIVDLAFDIRVIQQKYRKNLINHVYKDDRLNHNKSINILEKLAFIILKNKCFEIEDNEKYVVLLPDNIIEDGDFNKDIKELLDDELIAKHVSVALSDEILLNRQRVYNNKVKLSCYRDMTYVVDYAKKFQSILALPIEYFIITNYKTKREGELIGFIESDKRVVLVEESKE